MTSMHKMADEKKTAESIEMPMPDEMPPQPVVGMDADCAVCRRVSGIGYVPWSCAHPSHKPQKSRRRGARQKFLALFFRLLKGEDVTSAVVRRESTEDRYTRSRQGLTVEPKRQRRVSFGATAVVTLPKEEVDSDIQTKYDKHDTKRDIKDDETKSHMWPDGKEDWSAQSDLGWLLSRYLLAARDEDPEWCHIAARDVASSSAHSSAHLLAHSLRGMCLVRQRSEFVCRSWCQYPTGERWAAMDDVLVAAHRWKFLLQTRKRLKRPEWPSDKVAQSFADDCAVLSAHPYDKVLRSQALASVVSLHDGWQFYLEDFWRSDHAHVRFELALLTYLATLERRGIPWVCKPGDLSVHSLQRLNQMGWIGMVDSDMHCKYLRLCIRLSPLFGASPELRFISCAVYADPKYWSYLMPQVWAHVQAKTPLEIVEIHSIIRKLLSSQPQWTDMVRSLFLP